MDELEATAPPVHQHYSDEVALAVRSALTDAELFISYNIPAKALGPLVAALPQAPNDLRLNQRLAALHTRAGRFAEAAVCCHTLQTIYSDAGYPEEATRYGELADRYEERAAGPAVPEEIEMSHGVAEEAVAEEAVADDGGAQEFAVEEAPGVEVAEAEVAAPWPTGAAPAHEPVVPAGEESAVEEVPVPSAESDTQTDEIDLSSEWEDSVTVEADSAEQPVAEGEIAEPVETTNLASDEKINETIDEIRFYFAQGLPEQAWAALAKLQTLAPDDARVDQVRAELEAAAQTAAEAETTGAEESIEEITVDDIPQAEVVEVELSEAEAPEAPTPEVEIAAVESPEPEVVEAKAVEAEIPEVTVAEPEISEPVAAIEIEAPAAPEQEPEPEVVQAVVEPPPVVKAAPAPPQKKKPAPTPAPAPEPEIKDAEVAEPAPAVLQEFVSDLESSLGDNFMPGAVAQPAESPHAEKHADPRRTGTCSSRPHRTSRCRGSRLQFWASSWLTSKSLWVMTSSPRLRSLRQKSRPQQPLS